MLHVPLRCVGRSVGACCNAGLHSSSLKVLHRPTVGPHTVQPTCRNHPGRKGAQQGEPCCDRVEEIRGGLRIAPRGRLKVPEWILGRSGRQPVQEEPLQLGKETCTPKEGAEALGTHWRQPQEDPCRILLREGSLESNPRGDAGKQSSGRRGPATLSRTRVAAIAPGSRMSLDILSGENLTTLSVKPGSVSWREEGRVVDAGTRSGGSRRILPPAGRTERQT